MYIETGGKKMPVHFGMNALAKFGDLTGKSMGKVYATLNANISDLTTSEIIAFMYSAFVEGAAEADEECQVSSLRDVGKLWDVDGELMNKVLGIYNEQAPPAGEGDAKKKVKKQ